MMTVMTQSIFWLFFAVMFVGFMWVFGDMLTPFILGIAIAYMLNPIVTKLTKRKIPRWIIALIILVLFFTFVTLVFVLLAPMAFRQLQMLVDQAPLYFQSLVDYVRPHLGWLESRIGTDPIEQITTYLKDSGGKIAGVAGGLTGGLLGGIASGGKMVAGFMATLLLTPLIAFFMMKDWPLIVAWVEDLYPRRHETIIRRLLKNIDYKVAGFIRGQITVAFFLGIIYSIALTIAGLNYGFLIGFFAGVFSIIPLVGSTLGLVVGVAVAWFQTGDLIYMAVIAGIFALGQFIEGNFLTPKVVGDSVGLHPMWIMFALIAGGGLFGITGMLVAIPVAAIVGVLGGFAIEQYKHSPLYTSKPPKTKA
jgi:predicted PurR-regulated permease PerM